MSRFNLVLAALAVVQIVILLAIGGGDAVTEGSGPPRGFRPFSDLAVASTSEIALVGGDGDALRVVRAEEGDGWALAGRGGHPARTSKVEETVKALRKLHTIRELTSDASRHHDLEVADDHFNVHVTVKGRDGAIVGDFYLGEHGGADRLVYRSASEDAVWSAAGPDSWAFDASVGSWVDTKHVDLDQDAVRRARIDRKDGDVLELVAHVEDGPSEEPAGKEEPGKEEPAKEEPAKEEPAKEEPAKEEPAKEEPAEEEPAEEEPAEEGITWTVLVDGEEKPADTSKVTGTLGSLCRLYMAEPIGKEIEPAYGFDEPTARAVLTMKDGSEHTLTVGAKREDENDWYFQSSTSEFVVTIRDYTVTETFQKKAADLLAAKPEEGEDQEPEESSGKD